jgi:gamma-glutamyltranspeptidase/glutathione hydrolase
MTTGDFQAYAAEILQPVRQTYRGLEVLSAPPPHSGPFVLEALNILENVDLRPLGHFANSGESLHLLAETLRRVYADRTAFLADPRFEPVPLDGLLSKEYAWTRLRDINRDIAVPREYRKTPAGDPVPFQQAVPAEKIEQGGHTTHLGVIDGEGNVVSLTQTLGTFFGSGVTVSGVLMNNAMSNFSTTTTRNSIQPGKQPRSSISPTIVLKDGAPYLSVGSPGATRIIATVVQLIINVVDYEMPAAEANRAPRILCQKADDFLHLESRISGPVRADLERRGHILKVYGDFDLFFGGAQIILRDPATGMLSGSADPRRGGVAIGY